VRVGDHVTGGDVYATVIENSLITHSIILAPKARGTITFIADKGQYNLTVRFSSFLISANCVGDGIRGCRY
jgi:vacuolar-type H+-ATPase catalytic subunit A/Vma1